MYAEIRPFLGAYDGRRHDILQVILIAVELERICAKGIGKHNVAARFKILPVDIEYLLCMLYIPDLRKLPRL